VAIPGDNWKQGDVENTLRKICKYEIELMGGAPFDVISSSIISASGAGAGDAEHANGTAININSDGCRPPRANSFTVESEAHSAGLTGTGGLRTRQYSRALWFAENIHLTEVFAMLRSGLWNKQDFYTDLARQINELESRPANKWQSAEQSSMDTWLDKHDYYNGPEFSVSYYTKGQVLGDLLDILIRDRTDNAKSLDDVLRKMNEDFAEKGKQYRDSLDIRLTTEQIAGGSFEDFFRKHVANAEPVPYESILSKAGLLLRGKLIGVCFSVQRDSDGKLLVRAVESGSTAERAGLRAGDEIAQWNGENIPRRIEYWLHNKKPGDSLKLRIVRNGEPAEVSFVLGGKTVSVFAISEDSQASPKARTIREGMLRGKTSIAKAAGAAAATICCCLLDSARVRKLA
jgi:predicted metalloprotease with PDZ domain